MKPRLLSALALPVITLFALEARAEPSGDLLFPVDNQGALARAFALPALGQASVLDAGHQQWLASLDWTNEFVSDQTTDASILEDGETQRYALDWRRGLGHGLEVSAELPLLITGGGILDGLVENWHNLFGLPDGGRETVPHHQYHYQYIRNGQTLLDMNSSTAGLGDIALGGGWQLTPGLALRAMAKLPTGDAGKLMGGNPGGALWADYNPFAASARWSGFLSAGASVNGTDDTLGAEHHPFVAFGGAGIGYRVFSRWRVLGQFYGHSQLYRDSDLSPLHKEGVQMTLGVAYDVSKSSVITAGFQEDVVTDSSPDISFHLDWSWR